MSYRIEFILLLRPTKGIERAKYGSEDNSKNHYHSAIKKAPGSNAEPRRLNAQKRLT
jgi:hypothetical protein